MLDFCPGVEWQTTSSFCSRSASQVQVPVLSVPLACLGAAAACIAATAAEPVPCVSLKVSLLYGIRHVACKRCEQPELVPGATGVHWTSPCASFTFIKVPDKREPALAAAQALGARCCTPPSPLRAPSVHLFDAQMGRSALLSLTTRKSQFILKEGLGGEVLSMSWKGSG